MELTGFQQTLENLDRNVHFVIGVQGLETSVDIVMTERQWQLDDDLPANMTWEHVTVYSIQDREAWIAAKNRWLEAAWTPNQSLEERQENAKIMLGAEAEMAQLEARPASVARAAKERYASRYEQWS